MKKVNVAIIGTGRIGALHIENISRLRQKAKIVAIADPFAKNLEELCAEYGIGKHYKNYAEVLNDPEVEAVIIATSTNTHAEIAIAAAQKGKHIFCEKPLDTDLDKINEVLRAADDAVVTFQTGFNRRFDHNFRRVREFVKDGTIGDVNIVKITSRDPAPPPIEYVKVSGGLFFDMMIHDFDMARYLAGSEVVEVMASGAVLVDPAIGEAGDVDTAIVTLKFANGALGVIDNSRKAAYGYDQRVEAFGSKGVASCVNDKPSTVELSTGDGVSTDKIPYFFLDRYTGAFIDQFNEFFDAINENRQPLVSAIDGMRAVQIAKAAAQSLKTGAPVKIVNS